MLSLLPKYGLGTSIRLAAVVSSVVPHGSALWILSRQRRQFSATHSQDTLYLPFATDYNREHASIMFWVSKNTNLKEVNVNIRVGNECGQ